jgi:hypothetical protein
MDFWLMPETEHLTFMVTFPRDDDFEQIVDVIRPLMIKRILRNVPQLRHVIRELGSPDSLETCSIKEKAKCREK